MSAADDEVERLLQRTRANRERMNNRMAAIGNQKIKHSNSIFRFQTQNFITGETARPIRSPLREKNISQSDTPYRRSPIKTSLRSSPVAKASSSPGKTQSPIRTTYSPIRTDTFKVKKTVSESPAKVSSFSRVFEDKDGSSKSEETFNRESSEKKTTILDGKPEDGNYTRTTITEREETIEKREVLKFTEVAGKRPRSPQKILEEYRAKRDKEMASDSKQQIKIDLSSSQKTKEEDSKNLMGSPSRFGSCRDTGSAVDEVFSSPARRSRLDLSLSPSKSASKISASPVRKFANLEEKTDIDVGKRKETNDEKVEKEEVEEDDGSYRSAQRKRLKALACKFNDYVEEDSESIKQVLAQASATGSPYKRDLTKTVDVDKIINRSSDPDLVKSLKAQGFEETSSKSKLVYDFTKKSVNEQSRDSSPYRPDPMQYIRPQKNATPTAPPTAKQPSPTKTKYRSVSPTRMASPQQRPPSPFKPHPLQFVSPQKASAPPPPPPKPPRTYIDMEEEALEESVDQAATVHKSEARLLVADVERTDTASRRSILEKKSLFEAGQSPEDKGQDPAMLPLSQRKALFEKNKSAVPKPIARFGESVTPAMLSKAKVNCPPASEPAWKRQRRNQSPESKASAFLTPALKHAENTQSGFRNSGIEPKKNLFDSRWKSNDIAKSQEEAKKKDMEMLMNRFKKVSEDVQEERRTRSPSPVRIVRKEEEKRTPSPAKSNSPQRNYPGVDVKKIKVSPPRPGNLYPDLTDIHDRPETAMSEESSAPSEAPSLGTAIKRMASPLKSIAESNDGVSDEEEMEVSGMDDDINDMLDEALDDSQVSGPTPPKVTKRSTSPSTSSAASWEFQTPLSSVARRDFKTPRVDNITDSPQAELPQVETESGSSSGLMHTVSFYRKQKPAGNVIQLGKIVRNTAANAVANDQELLEEEDGDDNEEKIRADIAAKINKLQEEVDEQMQRRAQASKALGVCEGQNEFEGSYERVEFERLLLEAHHKHNAATAEINRLKNITARGQLSLFRGGSGSNGSGKSKGTISLNGIKLPLKPEFVKMIQNPGHGGDDFVHYFVCLVKYRSQVIATQMLSTVDGINRSGQLEFPNLINIKELEFDFQIYLEVYGLQTPKEVLTHEAKYHIRKDKSLFSLGTPLKKLKKMESKFVMTPSSNPVNALSIRKSKFGMVGYTTITIDSLRNNKSFILEKVPNRSPLQGALLMNLSVHSESSMQEKGFLTYFTEVNGYGDWIRRWCVLRGNCGVILHFNIHF